MWQLLMVQGGSKVPFKYGKPETEGEGVLLLWWQYWRFGLDWEDEMNPRYKSYQSCYTQVTQSVFLAPSAV